MAGAEERKAAEDGGVGADGVAFGDRKENKGVKKKEEFPKRAGGALILWLSWVVQVGGAGDYPGVDVVEGGDVFILGGVGEGAPEVGGKGGGARGAIVEPLEGGEPLLRGGMAVGERNEVKVGALAGGRVGPCDVGFEGPVVKVEIVDAAAVAADMEAGGFDADDGRAIEWLAAVALLYVLSESAIVVGGVRGRAWGGCPGAKGASIHWCVGPSWR